MSLNRTECVKSFDLHGYKKSRRAAVKKFSAYDEIKKILDLVAN